MSTIKTRTIRVQLSDDQINDLKILLESYGKHSLGCPVTSISALAEMLLSDAAEVINRPGSWEGANMATVLRSHGWRL